MNRLLKTALAIGVDALVGLPLLFAPPEFVQTAQSVLCSPTQPGIAMTRTIGGTLSSVQSGAVYTLNGQGCARSRSRSCFQTINTFSSA